jgi:hypothetical protein
VKEGGKTDGEKDKLEVSDSIISVLQSIGKEIEAEKVNRQMPETSMEDTIGEGLPEESAGHRAGGAGKETYDDAGERWDKETDQKKCHGKIHQPAVYEREGFRDFFVQLLELVFHSEGVSLLWA